MTVERWVVYATFDAEGLAAPFAEDQLRAYRQLGFRTLVVDTSPRPTAERIAAWERSSTAWRQRENVGYDFGSYHHGLALLLGDFGVALPTLDLLLTNDSCYGPYAPLAEVFRRFDSAPRDGRQVFGMTDSAELSPHLQSYWLYFRADVVHHARDFLASVAPVGDRAAAIGQGEIGLSRHLGAQGCRLVAYRASTDVVRHFARFHGWLPSFVELAIRWHRHRPRYTREGDRACLKTLLGKPVAFNQTLAFGTHLHFQSMLPFVKRQLVRENPRADPLVPRNPPDDPRDNACIDRWLRSTEAYRRRYGRSGLPAP